MQSNILTLRADRRRKLRQPWFSGASGKDINGSSLLRQSLPAGCSITTCNLFTLFALDRLMSLNHSNIDHEMPWTSIIARQN